MRTAGMFFFWEDHPVPETSRTSTSQCKVRKQTSPSNRSRHAIRQSKAPSNDYSSSDESSTSSNSSGTSWSSKSNISSSNCSEKPTHTDTKKKTVGLPMGLMRLMCFAPEAPEEYQTMTTTKVLHQPEEETLDEDHIIFFEREIGVSGQTSGGVSYDDSFIEDLESRSEIEQPRQRPTTIQVHSQRNTTNQSQDDSANGDMKSKCSFDSDDDLSCEPPAELVVSKLDDVESDDDSSISDSSFSSVDSSWSDSEVDPSFDEVSDNSSSVGSSTDSEMQQMNREETNASPFSLPAKKSRQTEEGNHGTSKWPGEPLPQSASTVVTLKVCRRDFKKSKTTQSHSNQIEDCTPTKMPPLREEHIASIVPVCVPEACDASGEESQSSEEQMTPGAPSQTIGYHTERRVDLQNSILNEDATEHTPTSTNAPSAIVMEIVPSNADKERRALPDETIKTSCYETKQEYAARQQVSHAFPQRNPPDTLEKTDILCDASLKSLEERDDKTKVPKMVEYQDTALVPCTRNAWSATPDDKVETNKLPRHQKTSEAICSVPSPCTYNAKSTKCDNEKEKQSPRRQGIQRVISEDVSHDARSGRTDDKAEMGKLSRHQETSEATCNVTVPSPCTHSTKSTKRDNEKEGTPPRRQGFNKVISEDASRLPRARDTRSTRLDFLKTVQGVKKAQPKATTEETQRQGEKDVATTSPSKNPDQWTARNVRERRRIRMGKLRLARSTKAATSS